MSSASLDAARRPLLPLIVLAAVVFAGSTAIAGWFSWQTTSPAPARPAAEDRSPPRPKRILRVAADPNNMPFTNARGEGFENKLAALIGRELDAEIEYVWRPQRRGFYRTMFKEGDCDLVLGVPAGFGPLLTTKSYYRSSYVFVSREERGLAIDSFDAPDLRKLKVGVQLIGDDGINTPPAHALAARGLVDNIVGYTVYGDYAEECPPARIIDAVRKGEVDVAVAWGPLAGYYARKTGKGLTLTPVETQPDPSGMPFAFEICVGVRRGRNELRDEVDRVLASRRDEIRTLLEEYGIPQVPAGPPGR